MMQATWLDHLKNLLFGVAARITPAGWCPSGDVTPHWDSHGEPKTWQGRWWLYALSNAYYYAELVDGRIPAVPPAPATEEAGR